MSELKRVWIDTDTGIDDAFALISALKLKGLEIVGVSAVNGNVEVEKTFRNARNIVSLCKREDVKVYKGASCPLSVKPAHSYDFHGVDGLGGAIVPDSKAKIEDEAAIDALYKKAKELNGELYIAAIGPLTNLATCMFKYPDFVKYIKEIDIMGGSIAAGGNASICAEFNIFGDPHAAQTVFKSGVPINMFGLDVTLKALLSRDEIESLKNINNLVTKFCYESSAIPMNLFKKLGIGDYMCLHDTCPLAYISDPSLFKGTKAGVYVETQSHLSMGRTISDLYIHSDDLFKTKNVTVMTDVDRDKLAKIVIETFKAYN